MACGSPRLIACPISPRRWGALAGSRLDPRQTHISPISLRESTGMRSRPGDTGLVLLVPAADPTVGPWREAHDPSAAEGMPAHITVLYPFIAVGSLNDQVIDEIAAICREMPTMEFTFAEFGHFPGVLWLKPNTISISQLVLRVEVVGPIASHTDSRILKWSPI